MTQKQGFTSPFDRLRVTKNEFINRLYIVSVYKVGFCVIPASEARQESFCPAKRKIPDKPE